MISQRLPVAWCQRRLAVVWFTGGGLLFAFLIAQTVAGKYGAQTEKAWAWLLPTVLPTLSLIVGAVAHSARRPSDPATADGFFFRVSFGLSVFYLILVLGTLLLEPLSSLTPLELMNISSLWLGPVQGLVGIALGVFFVSRQTEGPDSDRPTRVPRVGRSGFGETSRDRKGRN